MTSLAASGGQLCSQKLLMITRAQNREQKLKLKWILYDENALFAVINTGNRFIYNQLLLLRIDLRESHGK